MQELQVKQKRFCEEYVIDLNATQAAIRAGYSSKTSVVQGSRLLSNANVQAEIQKLMNERSEKTGITAATVLERINRIANSAESKGEYQAALKANELLGKHLKMFTDKTEITGADGGAIEQKWTVEIIDK